MDLTLEQITKALADPRSPLAQEIARRVEESEKPGAKTYTSDEVLAMINDQKTAEFRRLSVNINDETAAVLRKVMDDRDITATEAVRRAIGLLGWWEGVRRGGYKIVVVPPGETVSVEIPDFQD